MREIKFRAWVLDKKEMLDVDSINYGSRGYGKQLLSIDTFHNKKVPYHSFTLLQYTGLKDKNGVNIYEGDIVKVEYGIGKVVFYSAMFMIEWVDDKDANMESLAYSNVGYRLGHIREDLEVIGNIYSNPELLNK
jgi:uncharacterized phage protein (TIGR01671 family)